MRPRAHLSFPGLCRLTAALLMVLLAATALPARSQGPQAVVTIDQAEYVVALSDSNRPPGDAAGWRPVSLPDNWHLSRPGFDGSVWYRLRFTTSDTSVLRVLYLSRLSARNMRYFLNGAFLGATTPMADGRAPELHVPIVRVWPPVLQRAGENVIHIQVTGTASYRHGLTTVAVGPGLVLVPRHAARHGLQVTALAIFGGTLLFAALVSLAVWRGNRNQSVLLWFGLTALAWSIWALEVVWPVTLSSPNLQDLSMFLVRFLYVPALLVLCLRAAGTRHALIESALWAGIAAGAVVAVTLPAAHFPALMTVAWSLFLALQAAFLAFLIVRRAAGPRWTSHLLALALLVLLVLGTHDLGRWLGYVPYENLLLAPYATPFLILALGATVVRQHLGTVRALAQSNERLEQRVEEKVKEAQSAQLRMNQVLREQAVLRERQRIMSDMHDGIGADLVGLLGAVQDPHRDSPDMTRRVSQILADLRAIVDSLEPVEGDLGVVLGNIRYRMRAAIEQSGIRLAWKVEPLPAIGDLTPEKVLAVQRIVMEALSNALQHSGAALITVSASYAESEGGVVIAVADNGKGYDPARGGHGRGLRSMRERARRADVALEIVASPGAGTQVRLVMAAIADIRAGEALSAPREVDAA